MAHTEDFTPIFMLRVLARQKPAARPAVTEEAVFILADDMDDEQSKAGNGMTCDAQEEDPDQIL